MVSLKADIDDTGMGICHSDLFPLVVAIVDSALSTHSLGDWLLYYDHMWTR